MGGRGSRSARGAGGGGAADSDAAGAGGPVPADEPSRFAEEQSAIAGIAADRAVTEASVGNRQGAIRAAQEVSSARSSAQAGLSEAKRRAEAAKGTPNEAKSNIAVSRAESALKTAKDAERQALGAVSRVQPFRR